MLKQSTHKPAITFVLITVYITCFSVWNSHAQVLPRITSKFNTYSQANLREKIYTHTDKSFYLTGEILWFKIYDTEGNSNKLFNLSKVAYVELLDNNGLAVMQAKIVLDGGTGSGSLYLPFSINTGAFQLRAYTSWMKNFDENYFFTKQITIVNPVKPFIKPAQQAVESYDLQFFPEGGHLVKGLESKIAFKAVSTDGKGINCSGAIIANQNDTVIRFKTLKFGIGSFTLKPLPNVNYRAVIAIGGKTITKKLPDVSDAGYTLQVNDNGDNWRVQVQGTTDLSRPVYVIVHGHQTITLAENLSLVNGSASFNISKDKLGNGISYVTLFNEDQKPLCERLLFKQPSNMLTISAGTDDKVYTPRKKVNVSITTATQNNTPVGANLSVSVYRSDSLQNDDAAHIASYLLLSAELKGHIESPDYYFKNNGAEKNQAIDNLLLSQGWTQFDWSNLKDNTPLIKFLPEYTGHILAGSVVNATDKSLAKNIGVYLTVHGTPNQFYVTKSDSTGHFTFVTKDFYGSREIVVQTNSLQDSIYNIELASPFYDHTNAQSPDHFTLDKNLKKPLIDNSINMQVQNVFAANKYRQFFTPNTDSASFYGRPTKTYRLDDFTRFTTIEEVLREYVTAISVNKQQGKLAIEMYHDVDKPLEGTPLILLDGLPVFDADRIFKVDPLKIKRLDVVSANFLYGGRVFNGIMNFASYKSDGANFELNPRALVLDYDGLQLKRKFYSPVYNSDEQVNSTLPDFRTTLYWNPDVKTQNDGKINLSFFTGDKPGHYIGIVEGISANGEAGSQQFNFDVKK